VLPEKIVVASHFNVDEKIFLKKILNVVLIQKISIFAPLKMCVLSNKNI